MTFTQRDLLVCIIGSLRGGAYSLTSLRDHVIEPFRADTAVMVSYDTPYANVEVLKPMHIWRIIEYNHWENFLSDLNSKFATTVNVTKHNWLTWGGIRPRNGEKTAAGSSGILLGMRALLSKYLEALVSNPYKRIIVTRSDYFHACMHENIFPKRGQIFTPTGEGWGGVTDRYTLFRWEDRRRVLNTYDWLIEHNVQRSGSLEQVLQKYYQAMDLQVLSLRRTMFTIGTEGDKTRWMPYKRVSCLPHTIFLKYISEFETTRRICQNITRFGITQDTRCDIVGGKHVKPKSKQ